ncbi:MAG: ribulokinase [Treponema sp.]|jgi:L-ribulokinase|nr:ribulokinase [Treponema sp.]
MDLKQGEHYVLGLDYGTDSCRAVIFDASPEAAGRPAAGTAVAEYPRWARGLYCDPAENRFRQHPLDYIETLKGAVREAAAQAGPELCGKIRGIGIDTTASTPCAVDREGTPLALKREFAENPSAMFVLWKDHTAIDEAERINRVTQSWDGPNYTRFTGGTYSSEWFWAKVLRILEEDQGTAAAAYSFLEHCEWMSALLTGNRDIFSIKRSRCPMGHKGLWHPEFGGYPPKEYFERIDPRLPGILATLGRENWPADTVSGPLTEEWAAELGLPAGIPVAVGSVDAHVGAVGGGVGLGRMVLVVGTSTCAMILGPKPSGQEKPIRGICGQVDGSIVPGMIGYEAGQTAFGDVYAWFRDLLLWPLESLPAETEGIYRDLRRRIIPALEKAGEALPPGSGGLTALDWFNGRRTPDVNPRVKGAITGLTLGSGAPRIFRALVEGTAFGARAIWERFREEGIPIDSIAAVGGIARKSSFVMQIMADVVNKPIDVVAEDQSVALGSAMFAAAAAGLYPDVSAAQRGMGSPIEKTYTPDPERAAAYNTLYRQYKLLGAFVEVSG